MNGGRRRGVTRAYVAGLIFAVTIVAFSMLLASWGGISLATGGGPVSTPGIGLGVAALLVILCLALLAWGLWTQAILLLRGRRSPSLPHMLLVGLGGYLLWCLGGLLVGLSIEDTWISPYAAVLALAWALCSLMLWAVMLRRVYTERPTPQWPWERRGDIEGPDWAISGDNPWRDPDDDGTGHWRDPDDDAGEGPSRGPDDEPWPGTGGGWGGRP